MISIPYDQVFHLHRVGLDHQVLPFFPAVLVLPDHQGYPSYPVKNVKRWKILLTLGKQQEEDGMENVKGLTGGPGGPSVTVFTPGSPGSP